MVEKNENYENIYDDIIKESNELFSKWSDEDFFSDKAEHVYFYDINSENSFLHSISNLSLIFCSG